MFLSFPVLSHSSPFLVLSCSFHFYTRFVSFFIYAQKRSRGYPLAHVNIELLSAGFLRGLPQELAELH